MPEGQDASVSWMPRWPYDKIVPNRHDGHIWHDPPMLRKGPGLGGMRSHVTEFLMRVGAGAAGVGGGAQCELQHAASPAAPSMSRHTCACNRLLAAPLNSRSSPNTKDAQHKVCSSTHAAQSATAIAHPASLYLQLLPTCPVPAHNAFRP
jgi:hypothetical protein